MISSFDTNVLVYATAPSEIEKGARARDLFSRAMRGGTSVLLLQTLAEFSNVTTRKFGMPVSEVRRMVEAWRAVFLVEPAVADDVTAALQAIERNSLSFWDAMLWAGAARLGVRYLFTEDLQDGRLLQAVRFVNPFDDANNALVDEALPP